MKNFKFSMENSRMKKFLAIIATFLALIMGFGAGARVVIDVYYSSVSKDWPSVEIYNIRRTAVKGSKGPKPDRLTYFYKVDGVEYKGSVWKLGKDYGIPSCEAIDRKEAFYNPDKPKVAFLVHGVSWTDIFVKSVISLVCFVFVITGGIKYCTVLNTQCR